MHGLINRSIEGFLRDTYGEGFWHAVAEAAGVDPRGFHTLRERPEADIRAVLATAARDRGKPVPELLEDLGAWLAQRESVRRLLRFSGRDFGEFLLSLDELPGRAHLVVPDLGMPRIAVETVLHGASLRVAMPEGLPEWRSVVAGLIRAMADDYGALGLVSVEDETISVLVSDDAFAAGRAFHLSAAPLEAAP